jgi:hypothetical protein
VANTTTSSGNVATRFDSEFFREYVRNQRFSPFTGTEMNSLFVIKEERGSKKISIPLITKLSGDGKTGSATLRGSGEQVGNYSFELTPTYRRNAVEFDKEELEKPEFDMRSAARPLLMDWAMEKTRDDMIQALCAVQSSGTYYDWADADATARNAWSVANSDRILYGTAKSNYSGVVATDLAKVDTTNDTLDKGIIGIAKRMAQTASPAIRPWRPGPDSYEQFVMFVGSRAYRDLHSSLGTELQNAMERGRTNPIWQPGDLMIDNVLVREIPEITTLLTDSADFATANAGGGPVEPCFLCGAQAVGWALSQRPRTIVDDKWDYEFQPGVAVQMKHDIKKMFFNNKQHGVVTVFVAGAADA